tara:strand:- start:75 stop:653 length:579 start_codon:yes stop_codon:yes gene_type:complete
MLKDLIKLADHLDSKGLVKEADYLDRLINKSASAPKMTSHQYTYSGGLKNPFNWGEAFVDATSLGNWDLADAKNRNPLVELVDRHSLGNPDLADATPISERGTAKGAESADKADDHYSYIMGEESFMENSYDDVLPSGIDLVNSLMSIHTKLDQAFRATLQQSPEEKEVLIEAWQKLEPEIRKIKEVALKKI